MVVCTCLPINTSKLLVMMRKVEGTEETSQELRTVGRYTIGTFIAAGNYGKVKKANRIDTGEEVMYQGGVTYTCTGRCKNNK